MAHHIRPGGVALAGRLRFLATIYRIWILRYVDVPEEVTLSLVKQCVGTEKVKSNRPQYIPVVAFVNGRSTRTTLVPAGGGRYRLQFNATLRKAAQADVGDVVCVELRLDRETRELPVPADLGAALKKHPRAGKAFHDAPPGYRRQMLKWMDSSKSEATRARRVAILIDRMLERAILGPARKKRTAGLRNGFK